MPLLVGCPAGLQGSGFWLMGPMGVGWRVRCVPFDVAGGSVTLPARGLEDERPPPRVAVCVEPGVDSVVVTVVFWLVARRPHERRDYVRVGKSTKYSGLY